MKITFIALCVVLPVACFCTPLPEPCTELSADASASAKGQGSTKAKAEATATVSGGEGTDTPSDEGDKGTGSVDLSATATASTTLKTEKCTDVEGFADYSVVLKSEIDLTQLSGKKWMLVKSTQVTQEIQTEVTVCAPLYVSGNCQASEFEIDVSSETEMKYIVYGYDGSDISYVRRSLSVTSEKNLVVQSTFETIAKASSQSQQVTLIEQKDEIETYFQQYSNIAFLDISEEYMVGVATSGTDTIAFVSVTVDVYGNAELKQQIIEKTSQVLQSNNIDVSNMIELSSTIDVDVDSFPWDDAVSGGSSGSASVNTSAQVEGKGGKAKASGEAEVTVGNDDTTSDNTPRDTGEDDTKTDENGAKGTAKGEAEVTSGGKGSSASAEGEAEVTSGGKGSSASAKGEASVSAGGKSGGKSGGSASGSSGKTGHPQSEEFSQYSVLFKADFEQQLQQSETTYFLWKITQSSETIESDTFFAADRYATEDVAVKFQYTKGCLKEWSYDGANLLYIQEDITFADEEYAILTANVVNVMTATKESTDVVSAQNTEQIETYLNSDYAVLGTDFETYFIGQTSCDKGSITFVAIHQEYYESEEKQQEIWQIISEILQINQIDESSFITLTKQFDVNTNDYGMVKTKTEISSDGKSKTTKQEIDQESKDGSKAKATTKTEIKSGGDETEPVEEGGSGGTATATGTAKVNGKGGSAVAEGSSSVDAENGKVSAKGSGTAEVDGKGGSAVAEGSSSVHAENGKVSAKGSSAASVEGGKGTAQANSEASAALE